MKERSPKKIQLTFKRKEYIVQDTILEKQTREIEAACHISQAETLLSSVYRIKG
jgi:hypothetical protein